MYSALLQYLKRASPLLHGYVWFGFGGAPTTPGSNAWAQCVVKPGAMVLESKATFGCTKVKDALAPSVGVYGVKTMKSSTVQDLLLPQPRWLRQGIG